MELNQEPAGYNDLTVHIEELAVLCAEHLDEHGLQYTALLGSLMNRVAFYAVAKLPDSQQQPVVAYIHGRVERARQKAEEAAQGQDEGAKAARTMLDSLESFQRKGA